MSARLIVALDFNHEADALSLLDKLNPAACSVKIGSEMVTLLGAPFVRAVVAMGFQVFLDLKFHDIPNTVAHACLAARDLGVWMLDVHASGGLEMMGSALRALEDDAKRPILIAVTVLTSMDLNQMAAIGVSGDVSAQVCRLAQLAKTAGLDGVVCSAQETQLVKRHCGESFIAVTPGVRPLGAEKNDQARVVTPEMAVKAGSDYLVIGRPITRAPNPQLVVDELLCQMQ